MYTINPLLFFFGDKPYELTGENVFSLENSAVANSYCIGHYKPRAASLPRRTEQMKMQDGHERIV